MGYCIDQGETQFTIKKDKQAGALEALKESARTRPRAEYYDAQILAATDLVEALGYCVFDATIDKDSGDIIDLDHRGEKLCDQERDLSLISPYVEEGSFIEFSGEDHATWRWLFKDEYMKQIEPIWNME
jgi:hypothetical protein